MPLGNILITRAEAKQELRLPYQPTRRTQYNKRCGQEVWSKVAIAAQYNIVKRHFRGTLLSTCAPALAPDGDGWPKHVLGFCISTWGGTEMQARGTLKLSYL
jgi:hypothetical protein